MSVKYDLVSWKAK